MPITVLHLVASNFFGGPEKQIVGHATAVARDRVNCIVGCFTERGQQNALLSRAESLGLRTFDLRASHPFDIRQVLSLRSYLKTAHVDILCAHGYRAIIIGLLATRISRVALLAYFRGWTAENRKVRIWYALASVCARWADGAVTVSKAQAEQLKRRCRLPEQKLLVVYNAVDTDMLDRSASPGNDVRAEMDVPQGCLLVVSVGRLSPEKGYCYLIDAASKVVQSFRNIRFIIVGDGPEEENVTAQVRASGLDEYVKLVGFRNDALRYISAADLVVLPSLSEGMPNVLLEAAAASRACVATAVGGVPEVVDDGISGLIVPPADSPALASAIVRALRDEELRQRLGCATRRRVEERFRFDAQARELERLYSRFSRM